MNIDDARAALNQARDATHPGTLPHLEIATLKDRYDSLSKARDPLSNFGYPSIVTDEILRALRQEMEAKIAAERSERHQKENVRWNKRILRVAKWTLAAAIVIPIAVVLIGEITSSILRRAKSSEPPAESSPTASMSATPTPRPTQSASPIESSTASPTPATEATPAP